MKMIIANIYWELICQDIVWIYLSIIMVNLNIIINSSITTVKTSTLRLTIRIDTFWEALSDALEGLSTICIFISWVCGGKKGKKNLPFLLLYLLKVSIYWT